jgi:hypothetical protein
MIYLIVHLPKLWLERKDKVLLSRKSKIILIKPSSSTYLDNGTMAFMKWLSATENNETADTSIVIKHISKDKYIIFYDMDLLKNVTVVFSDCVPWCKNCEADDCGHVGFAICLKQYYSRFGSADVWCPSYKAK